MYEDSYGFSFVTVYILNDEVEIRVNVKSTGTAIRNDSHGLPSATLRLYSQPHLNSLTITMSARYAPLPTQRPSEHSDDELDAAFNGSDDELDYDDDNAPAPESQPLNPSRSGRVSPPHSTRTHLPTIAIPGAYDFERVDYDVPPPGSPTRAMVNDYGNSNGHIPSFDTDADSAGLGRQGSRSWFSRTAANLLPSHYVHRLGLGGPSTSAVHVGGGDMNDGVFSNISAKPERRRLRPTGAWRVMYRADPKPDSPFMSPQRVTIVST